MPVSVSVFIVYCKSVAVTIYREFTQTQQLILCISFHGSTQEKDKIIWKAVNKVPVLFHSVETIAKSWIFIFWRNLDEMK